MSQFNDDYSFDDKPKRKHSDDPTSWGQAWQAIGLFLSMVLLLGGIGGFLQNAFYGDKIAEYMQILGGLSTSPNPILNTLSSYQASPLLQALMLVIGALVWLIGLFIIYGLSHRFATGSGGLGTLRGLIVRGNNWMMIMYLLFFVGNIIINYILVNNIVSHLQGIDWQASTQEGMDAYVYMQSQLAMLYIFDAAIWLIWNIGLSNIVAKYYGLGQGKGCMAVFLMNVSIFAAYCGISMIFGLVLFSALR